MYRVVQSRCSTAVRCYNFLLETSALALHVVRSALALKKTFKLISFCLFTPFSRGGPETVACTCNRSPVKRGWHRPWTHSSIDHTSRPAHDLPCVFGKFRHGRLQHLRRRTNRARRYVACAQHVCPECVASQEDTFFVQQTGEHFGIPAPASLRFSLGVN